MKRHISILAICMMALVVAFGSCKKDNPTQPTDAKTYTVKYKIDNQATFTNPLTGETTTLTLSPCFKFDFTYVDAEGKTVEKTGVTAPWETTLSVKRPFTAKMEGELVYDENDLPDDIYYGTPWAISITGNGTILSDNDANIGHVTKENFLGHIAGTQRLKFSGEVSLNN